MIGITQTPDLERALFVAREQLMKGVTVQIRRVHFFGELTREHLHEFEYEVCIQEES